MLSLRGKAFARCVLLKVFSWDRFRLLAYGAPRLTPNEWEMGNTISHPVGRNLS